MSSFKIFCRTFFITSLVVLLLATLVIGIVAVDGSHKRTMGIPPDAPIVYEAEKQEFTVSFLGQQMVIPVAAAVKKVKSLSDYSAVLPPDFRLALRVYQWVFSQVKGFL